MDTRGAGEGGRLTGVNWLTRVNQVAKCVKRVNNTRTVGFKIPAPLVDAYSELPSSSKAAVKTVVMSVIYALAKRHGIDVECEEQLQTLVADVPLPSGTIVLNVNVAEARPSVNININIINEIREIAEELYKLRAPLPPKQRELVERLFKTIQRMN